MEIDIKNLFLIRIYFPNGKGQILSQQLDSLDGPIQVLTQKDTLQLHDSKFVNC